MSQKSCELLVKADDGTYKLCQLVDGHKGECSAVYDPRNHGVYVNGAVCDECGKPSSRVRVCGECQLAERIHEDRDKRQAELEAENARLLARVKVLEARQQGAVALLSGSTLGGGVAREDAPATVDKLPDYWDAKRAEAGKDRSTCAAELRRALDGQWKERTDETLRCDHSGIGLPGCLICDPRTVSEGGPQPD